MVYPYQLPEHNMRDERQCDSEQRQGAANVGDDL